MECDRPACALGLQHRDGHFGEICALCIWCEESYTAKELQAKNMVSLQRLIDIDSAATNFGSRIGSDR